ncbi:MAG: ComEC/Rec2 family competence protein, partial [bacterium]
MRRLAWIGFTFAGAILLAAALLPAGWALLLCALAAAGLGLSLLRERLRRGFLPLLLLGAALGFGWFSFREAITLSPARALDGQSGVWEATVESFPKPAVTTTMVNLTLETEEGRVAARLYSFEDAAELLRPGDRVSVRAALALADRMDEEETGYWFSEGVFLTLRSARELTLLSRPEKLGLRHTLLSWGEALRGALAAAFPEDVSALAVALVTGDKTGLAEHRLALRRAGIYHLATVSGLHIAIIAGFFHTLFGNRRWAGLLIAPFLLAFAGMV